MTVVYIVIGVIIILVVYVITKYNAIVKLRNIRSQSFADIDVQLKLRFDLVPNLVETVKGYASHEKQTLENVTKARTSFMNASGIDDKMQADNMLTWALKSLFAVSENYPDLKANQNFLQLQTELSDIENKIAAARRFFNNATQEYNTYIQIFPSNIIANAFNFHEETLFGVSAPEERDAVKVSF